MLGSFFVNCLETRVLTLANKRASNTPTNNALGRTLKGDRVELTNFRINHKYIQEFGMNREDRSHSININKEPS